jgi:hypothetical protein
MASPKSLEMKPNKDGSSKHLRQVPVVRKARSAPKDTNLTRKVAIITGANIGLGFAAAAISSPFSRRT